MLADDHVLVTFFLSLNEIKQRRDATRSSHTLFETNFDTTLLLKNNRLNSTNTVLRTPYK